MTKCSCCFVRGILPIAAFCKEAGCLEKRSRSERGRSWREDSGSIVKGGKTNRRAHSARTARRQHAQSQARGCSGVSVIAHFPSSGASRTPRRHLGAPLLSSQYLTHQQGPPGLPPRSHLALFPLPMPGSKAPPSLTWTVGVAAQPAGPPLVLLASCRPPFHSQRSLPSKYKSLCHSSCLATSSLFPFLLGHRQNFTEP